MKGSSIQLSNMTGIVLLFLTCLAFAGYSVLARSLSRHFSPAELSYLMMGIGFATFLILSLTGHAASGTFGEFLSPLGSGTFILSAVYLGVIASLVTTLTSTYILSKIEASLMSVFTNLSTIVSIAAGAFFLGEEITVYHWIGSLLIIAGVIGTNRLGRNKPVQVAGRSDSV
jgi:drug/metabolite transporter (DMT)-like permease